MRMPIDSSLAAQRDGDDRAPAVAAELVEVRVGGLRREVRRLAHLAGRSPPGR